MRARHSIPGILILLLTIGAISVYDIASRQMARNIEKSGQEVVEPEYTYLSPFMELSPFDEHFREAADSTGYDWTLIAAIAFTESRFDSTAISDAGAQGVMQVMPKTMRGFNVPDSLHSDNYTNIMTAAKLLKSLERRFRYIKDPDERIKFILASYNAGFGYIHDAMRLAKKYGYDRYKWDANVDSFLIHMSQPEYYTDSLCRNGEFNGWRETLSFVRKVQNNWRKFSTLQQNYTDSIMLVLANDSTKRIMQ